MMTDHHKFVLFNIYFPNGGKGKLKKKKKINPIHFFVDNQSFFIYPLLSLGEERLEYKKRFYRVVSSRCQELLAQGRSVIVLGDFNIAHQERDIWHPEYSLVSKKSGFLPWFVCRFFVFSDPFSPFF